MKIRDRGDWIELNVIIEKFKKKLVVAKMNGKPLKDEDGKIVKQEVEVFEKEVLVPTRFLKSGITMNGQTPNHRYQVQKTKSTIFDSYSQKMYVVKHTQDEIEAGLSNRGAVGFQIGKTK